MVEFLVVGVSGMFGCCLRYGVTKILAIGFPHFIFSTLVVNVMAAFIIGAAMGAEGVLPHFPKKLKLAISTGFLGGLSSFSGFSAETFLFLKDGRTGLAALNISLNVFICIVAVALGYIFSHFLTKEILTT